MMMDPDPQQFQMVGATERVQDMDDARLDCSVEGSLEIGRQSQYVHHRDGPSSRANFGCLQIDVDT